MDRLLPGIEPFGLGTPEVESLTSYVRRLAWWLHASPSQLLRWLVLGPTCRQRAQREFVFQPTRASESLNGTGAQVRLLVGALAQLTGRTDLDQLTFLDRESSVSVRNDFRIRRSWCPLCLAVPAMASYDRLGWTLVPFGICWVHGVVLVDECSGCGRAHRPLVQWAHPTRCPWCGTPLSQAPAEAIAEPESDRIQELIVRVLSPRGLARDEVLGLLQVDRRPASLRVLSRATGISVSELSWIRSGRVRPSVRSLRRLALGAHDLGRPTRGRRTARRRPEQRRPAELRARLARALRQRHAASLRQVARDLGATPAYLRGLAPELASRLVRRYRQQVRAGAGQSRGRVAAQIRRAVALVAARDGSVPRRGVERLLVRPGVLRAGWARAALTEARLTARGAPISDYVKPN